MKTLPNKPLPVADFLQLPLEDKEAFICAHLYKMPVEPTAKGGWGIEGRNKFKRRMLTQVPGVLGVQYMEMLLETMHDYYGLALRLSPEGEGSDVKYAIAWLGTEAKANTTRGNYTELYEAMLISAMLAVGLLIP